MAKTVTCSSCGWSWNKSDSSKKDVFVCHKCGKDNEYIPKAQNGIEGTMGGLTDKGFNYNGAWGGTMQFGGVLPGAMGNMYARHGAPSEGKYAKKTMPSAEEGYELLPTPDDPDRKYKLSAVVQSAKEILNPILRSKNPEVYDKWEADRIAALRKNAVKEYDASNPLSIYLSPEEVKAELNKQRKGYYEDYIGALKGISEYDLGKESYVGQKESNQPIEGLNYGSRFATAPVNLGRDQKGAESFRYSYIPKTEEYKKENFQNGGEMSFYQNGLDWTPKNISKNGGWLDKYNDDAVVKDDNGYWNPENWGKPVEIGSNEITMQGVDQDLIGVSDEGDVQLLKANNPKNYKFKGKKVTEFPVSKNGGWLDKYN
jgi:hypothetical protein